MPVYPMWVVPVVSVAASAPLVPANSTATIGAPFFSSQTDPYSAFFTRANFVAVTSAAVIVCDS